MNKIFKIAIVVSVFCISGFSTNFSEAAISTDSEISSTCNFEMLKSKKKQVKDPEAMQRAKLRESALGKPDYDIPVPAPKRNPPPSRF